MYVKYGGFQFNPEEAGLKVFAQFQRSSRGFKQYQIVRYDIEGEFVESDEYDTNTRLQAMIDAFSIDNQDCGLYHTDGTPTTHFLSSSRADNLTGNQVYYKRLPVTKDGEFVNGRKFELGVGALLLDYEQELLSHEDHISRTSNAGAEWRWRYDKWRGYYPILVAPSTMQEIHHYGSRVGMTTWPLPPTPLYSPPFEENHKRQVTQVAPRRWPNGYTEFKTTWHYVYTLPTFDDVTTPILA